MSNKLLTLAFSCSRFRGTARLVLLAIADRINEETWSCSCGYEDLMRRCHCARSVLAAALAELKNSGVLMVRRRFSSSTVYSLDAALLAQWRYAPKSTDSARVRKPNRSDSGERKYGFPNANPLEPNSPPPSCDDGRGAGTESLRFGGSSSHSEDLVGSSNAYANGKCDKRPASQETNLGGDPRTPRLDAGNVPVQQQGTASPRDPALPGSTPGETPDPPSRETEPARTLAWQLWCYVSVRPDVEVPYDWERLWTKDFDGALRQGYTYDDIDLAVRASQTGRARPMYVRALSIVKQLDRLIDNGHKLEKGGHIGERMCPYCKGAVTEFEYVKHTFEECMQQPEIDPADAAEEEFADICNELIDEGLVPTPPDYGLMYPWGRDEDEGTGIYPWGKDEDECAAKSASVALAETANGN